MTDTVTTTTTSKKNGRAGRANIFRPSWELDYAVKIITRDPTTNHVENAVCLFCQTFGREARPIPIDPDQPPYRRKRTKNIYMFDGEWRADKFVRHHVSMHGNKWDEYKEQSTAAKRVFFDIPVPVDNNNDDGTVVIATTTPHQQQSTTGTPPAEHATLVVEKNIIEVIMKDILYLANDEETDVDTDSARTTATTTHSIWLDNDADDEIPRDYVPTAAAATNTLQKELTMDAIGCGLSFQQAAHVIQMFRDRTDLQETIGDLTPQSVATHVQTYCAESFQIIAHAMRQCWTFSVALDSSAGGPTRSNDVPYFLDIRLRLVVGYELFDVHLIAVPMDEPYNDDTAFAVASKVLTVLCTNWNDKIIGVTTDGVSNMTGRHVGVATQIQQQVANTEGFYRVWCAAHQLDLAVQDRLKSMFSEHFIYVLHGITGYLRRQYIFINYLGSKCPPFIPTCWISMGTLLRWLVVHHRRLTGFFVERNAPCQPTDEWWIEAFALSKIARLIHVTHVELQGEQRQLLEQQRGYLDKLQHNLMRMGSVTEHRIPPQTVAPDVFQVGDFRSSLAGAETYLLNLGSTYIVGLISKYKEENPEGYRLMLTRLVDLFLYLIDAISTIRPERNEINGLVSRVPPLALPHGLASGGAFKFSTLVNEQKNRLSISFTETEIDACEDQFNTFLDRYHHDDAFKVLVQNTDACKTFRDAWEWLYNDFPMLVVLAGGLATTFPGTCTVDPDFSAIGWEKDDGSLDHLNLEGILHGKQNKAIMHLQSLLNMIAK